VSHKSWSVSIGRSPRYFFGRYFYSPRLAPVINPGLESSASSASFWLRVEDWILVGKFLVSGPRGNQESRAGRARQGIPAGDPTEPVKVAEGWRSGTMSLFVLFLHDFFCCILDGFSCFSCFYVRNRTNFMLYDYDIFQFGKAIAMVFVLPMNKKNLVISRCGFVDFLLGSSTVGILTLAQFAPIWIFQNIL